MRCFPFGPPLYTKVRKGELWAKPCEGKSVVLLGTALGNTLGTMWGTRQEHGETPPPPKLNK